MDGLDPFMAGGYLGRLRSCNDEWHERKQREHCQITSPFNGAPLLARSLQRLVGPHARTKA